MKILIILNVLTFTRHREVTGAKKHNEMLDDDKVHTIKEKHKTNPTT